MNNDFEEFDETDYKLLDTIFYNAYTERKFYVFRTITDETALLFNRYTDRYLEMDNGIPKPITILIDSPGGDAYAMLSIISRIEELKEKGYEIIADVRGKCMSAALWICVVCNKKVSQRYSRFLFHAIKSWNEPGFSSVGYSARQQKDTEEMWDLMKSIIIRNSNFTEEMINDITQNDKDFNFFAEKALELKIIDQIL